MLNEISNEGLDNCIFDEMVIFDHQRTVLIKLLQLVKQGDCDRCKVNLL
jgi:hypothetical protein